VNLFLGIDTSAYTTSVALVDEDAAIVADERIQLKVDNGKRGLRQSEAHFSHVRNLPVLMERMAHQTATHPISAVGVSDRPRRREDSYMPVFLAGLGVARCIGSVNNIPVKLFSHQEGHVEAALNGLPPMEPEFIAVHFSGGTSEILVVKRSDSGYDIDTLLATTDLNAGQLVDRVGVVMGLPFPAGPRLEKMACATGSGSIPSVVGPHGFSFSGAETRALRMLEEGVPPESVAYLVLMCIANTLEKSLRWAAEKTGLTDIVLAGGVMANQVIKQRLEHRFKGSGYDLHWSQVALSSDNAVGIALLARNCYQNEKRLGIERQ
jgi:N6-L-threonylcarbamoyladenine synthase